MTKVIADISMSLDGFVTGPDPDLHQGLGRGGERVWKRRSSEHMPPPVRVSSTATHHVNALGV